MALICFKYFCHFRFSVLCQWNGMCLLLNRQTSSTLGVENKVMYPQQTVSSLLRIISLLNLEVKAKMSQSRQLLLPKTLMSQFPVGMKMKITQSACRDRLHSSPSSFLLVCFNPLWHFSSVLPFPSLVSQEGWLAHQVWQETGVQEHLTWILNWHVLKVFVSFYFTEWLQLFCCYESSYWHCVLDIWQFMDWYLCMLPLLMMWRFLSVTITQR